MAVKSFSLSTFDIGKQNKQIWHSSLCLTVSQRCIDGSVRLTNGDKTGESKGIVEICLDGIWGTLPFPSMTNSIAEVICRQLGFPWNCK